MYNIYIIYIIYICIYIYIHIYYMYIIYVLCIYYVYFRKVSEHVSTLQHRESVSSAVCYTVLMLTCDVGWKCPLSFSCLLHPFCVCRIYFQAPATKWVHVYLYPVFQRWWAHQTKLEIYRSRKLHFLPSLDNTPYLHHATVSMPPELEKWELVD